MPPSRSTPVSDIGSPDLRSGLLIGQYVTDIFESNPELMWPESAWTYARMRHDPQLKAVLSAIMLPILRATWVVDPTGCRDEVVQHCADDLGVGILGTELEPGPGRRRGVIWIRHLKMALYQQLVQGFIPFELRYAIEGQRAHLDALGPRMPWSVHYIQTNRDGTIASITQNTQEQPIPANRLIWYVNDLEGQNWTGTSALRACYSAWLLKHETWRVHATSIRRFGMGVPGVEAPAGATATQMAQARQLASAMRSGETAGMAIPNGFKPFLMGMEGSAPDALAFINYLDQVMAKQALAGLIELGQSQHGSRALGESFLDLFLLSIQAIADEVAITGTSGQVGTPGILTDLVDQNWGADEPVPRLVCTDVGTNYELTSAALSSMTTSGALQPDETIDSWVRDRWQLPKRKAPWTPPPAKGGGGPAPAPAGNSSPPAPGKAPDGAANAPGGGTAPAGTPAVAAARETRVPRAESSVLRRQPTEIEAASGFDPEQHQTAWQRSLDALMNAYASVAAAQKVQIVDEVQANLAQGTVGKLASISVAVADGVRILAQAMLHAWQDAVVAMLGEADRQGVHIDAASVPEPDFTPVAYGRAQFAATYMAQQGGSRAMRGVQPGRPAKAQQTAVVNDVSAFLDDLSSRNLRDHLGGALTAAQNAGRVAVLHAAPASAGNALYVASEILDANTCKACEEEDGHEFVTLAAAEEAYPTGGYLHCQGDLRCRGTVVAVWDEQPAVAAAGVSGKFNPGQLRDGHGRWTKTPGSGVKKLVSKPGKGTAPWSVKGDVITYNDSLGIDRADMPQLSGTINGEYQPSSVIMPQFEKYLGDRGIKVTSARVPASSLKPTQTTGDIRVVRGIADNLKSGKQADTKPIFISSDNRILDGHHTWAGRQLADTEGGRADLPAGMPVMRADAPIDQLLGAANAFNEQVGIKKRKTGEVANPAFAHLVEKKPPVPGDTYDKYRAADGTWDAERAKLHQKIIEHTLADAPAQDHPIATFFGGGPASGKSSLTSPPHSAVVDPDEIKGQLPEYQQMTKAGDPSAAQYTHEESSFVAASALAAARAKQSHFTLDGTGDSTYAKMAGKVKVARDAGYQVHGKYVTVDTDTAVQRAMKRAERTGRMVPESVIRSTHASVSTVFEQAIAEGLFDSVELWDNNGDGAARLIVSGQRGNVTIHDPAAYQSFLDKAKA